MKTKAVQAIPLFLGLLAIVFAEFSRWCVQPAQLCFRTEIDRIIPSFTYPLYFFALYLLPLALLLVFIPRASFNSWLKFAAWGIPIAALYIWTTPTGNSSIWLNLFPFYRDDAARAAGVAFTLISLLLIAYKYFILRRL